MKETPIAQKNGKHGDRQSRVAGLLSSKKALTEPDYHYLNRHAERNDRLLHAVLCSYAKHHFDRDEIGWEQLDDILMNAICNEIGDDAFCSWVEMMEK